jgi:hypothetical protein
MFGRLVAGRPKFQAVPADGDLMNPALSNPDPLGFLGNLSLGPNCARTIVAVFVFLGAAFAFYQLWRRHREYRRLDEAIKLHEETRQREAQATAVSGALHHRLKKDVWTN